MPTASPVRLAFHTEREIHSQPEFWQRLLDHVGSLTALLPGPGKRVLAVGCGSSYYILDSNARRRQQLGLGTTRAAIATELDDRDDDDAAVVLSRSGANSDRFTVARGLSARTPTVGVTGTPGSPNIKVAHNTVLLDFADERSVVQTRYATNSLTLLRASLGDSVESACRGGRRPGRAAALQPGRLRPSGLAGARLGPGAGRGGCPEVPRGRMTVDGVIRRPRIPERTHRLCRTAQPHLGSDATARRRDRDGGGHLRGLECDTPEHLSRSVVVE
ncbi:SIS domain-containing protein [Streptomyces sp. NPDC054864]